MDNIFIFIAASKNKTKEFRIRKAFDSFMKSLFSGPFIGIHIADLHQIIFFTQLIPPSRLSKCKKKSSQNKLY